MSTYTFPCDPLRSMRYGTALVTSLFGILTFTSVLPVSIVLFSITIFCVLYKRGIEIDPASNQYRFYKRIFNFRSGSWKDLSQYTALIILTKKGTVSVSSVATVLRQTHFKVTETQVYLTNAAHRKRMLLNTFSNKEDATAFANEVSTCINRPLEKYNPAISQATRNRIRQRK